MEHQLVLNVVGQPQQEGVHLSCLVPLAPLSPNAESMVLSVTEQDHCPRPSRPPEALGPLDVIPNTLRSSVAKELKEEQAGVWRAHSTVPHS